MKSIITLLLTLLSLGILNGQNVDFSKDITTIEKDYINLLTKLNYDNNITFNEPYNSVYIELNIEQIKKLIGEKFEVIEAGNLQYNITNETKSPLMLASAILFFVKIKSPITKKQGNGEFFPSKSPICFYWWNTIDDTLIFIYSSQKHNANPSYIIFP